MSQQEIVDSIENSLSYFMREVPSLKVSTKIEEGKLTLIISYRDCKIVNSNKIKDEEDESYVKDFVNRIVQMVFLKAFMKSPLEIMPYRSKSGESIFTDQLIYLIPKEKPKKLSLWEYTRPIPASADLILDGYVVFTHPMDVVRFIKSKTNIFSWTISKYKSSI